MAEERPEYKSEEIGKNFAFFGKYFSTDKVLDVIMNIHTRNLTKCAEKIFASKPTLSIVGEMPESFNFNLFKLSN